MVMLSGLAARQDSQGNRMYMTEPPRCTLLATQKKKITVHTWSEEHFSNNGFPVVCAIQSTEGASA